MAMPLAHRISNRCCATVLAAFLCGAGANAASLAFFENAAGDYDYGRQNSIPAGFGDGEFTLEIWLRPDNSRPVGSTSGGADQRRNWSNANPSPYSSSSWWYSGNFLLDGHNNNNPSDGTFSLQLFNGGRLRWLFGDGTQAASREGGLHAVQSASASSLLDGAWHQVTLVRRATGSGASLEMWIDGVLVDTEASGAMPSMRTWWNNWSGFRENGWVWGAEKQAALNVIPQWEDYKGNVDELRFWSRAKSSSEIAANFRQPVTGAEAGLVGHYNFEAATICSQVGNQNCIAAVNLNANARSSDSAPLVTSGGDTISPSVPTNLAATTVTSNRIDLSWTASTDNFGVIGYDVLRNGVRVGQPIATTFSDSSLSASTQYSYTVLARDAAGNASAQSMALSVTTQASPGGDIQAPTIPTSLVATSVSTSRVDLSWTASTDNVGVAGYDIYRNGVPAGQTATTTFGDSALSPNTTYSYTVLARDAAGNTSMQSMALSVTTLTGSDPDTQAPTIPTSLATTTVTTTRIDLSWTASTDNVAIAGYDVLRNGVRVGQPTAAAFSDSALSPSTVYSYTVLARDAAGNTSAQSAALSVTTSTATQPPPSGGGSGGGGGGQFGIEFLIGGVLMMLARARSSTRRPRGQR